MVIKSNLIVVEKKNLNKNDLHKYMHPNRNTANHTQPKLGVFYYDNHGDIQLFQETEMNSTGAIVNFNI